MVSCTGVGTCQLPVIDDHKMKIKKNTHRMSTIFIFAWSRIVSEMFQNCLKLPEKRSEFVWNCQKQKGTYVKWCCQKLLLEFDNFLFFHASSTHTQLCVHQYQVPQVCLVWYFVLCVVGCVCFHIKRLFRSFLPVMRRLGLNRPENTAIFWKNSRLDCRLWRPIFQSRFRIEDWSTQSFNLKYFECRPNNALSYHWKPY